MKNTFSNGFRSAIGSWLMIMMTDDSCQHSCAIANMGLCSNTRAEGDRQADITGHRYSSAQDYAAIIYLHEQNCAQAGPADIPGAVS